MNQNKNYPKTTGFLRLTFSLLLISMILVSFTGCHRTAADNQVIAQVASPTASVMGEVIRDSSDGSQVTPSPASQPFATTVPDDPSGSGSATITPDATPNPSVTVTPVPEQTFSTVSLLAVGDNLIHIQVIESGEQADGTYNYDHLYSNLKEDISAADIAVINQETIFGGTASPYSGYPEFNSPTEIGDAVIKAGFDVVLHATNHTMDMGVDGIRNTLAYWQKHPEIAVLGIHNSPEESQEITVIEKNGIKIAMLNYTFSLNGHSLPKEDAYLVDLLDREKMKADIEKAEKEADFTVVFPHWGTEYVYEPIRSQKELTDFYYDLGVDLVIGTHPHVLEPVEWIEQDPGHKMLVYYSLGNFMSYQRESPRMLGGIAKVTITKDATGTYISDASVTPIITHYENGPADYHYAIYKLSDYSPELAEKHGVSEIAQEGALTYEDTYNLAKEVLGDWFR